MAFPCQVMEELPTEACDVRLHAVLVAGGEVIRSEEQL
jgi:5-formyltetrahydrofolate cyclo-ligase